MRSAFARALLAAGSMACLTASAAADLWPPGGGTSPKASPPASSGSSSSQATARGGPKGPSQGFPQGSGQGTPQGVLHGPHGVSEEAIPRLGTLGPLTGSRARLSPILRTLQAVIHRAGVGRVLISDDAAMPVRTISAARYLENYHRVAAYLAPFESGGAHPYLARTQTPTLFSSTTIAAYVSGARIIGFPPSGAASTQVLLRAAVDLAQRRAGSRSAEIENQGIWVFVADTEDGKDRRRGVRAAQISGVLELTLPGEGPLSMPRPTAPDVVVIIAPASQAVRVALEVLKLSTVCSGSEATVCAKPPVIAAAVFEPYDWAELASVPEVLVAEWLPTDATTLVWHRSVLQQVLPNETPSRLSLWGHAVAELTTEALRRAGPKADGERLLRAAQSLRGWQGRLLPPVTLGPQDAWPIKHVAVTTLTRGRPTDRGPWIALPRFGG